MRNPLRVSIVLHGDRPNESDIRLWTGESDVIIAADGAADLLLDMGVTPNVLIGDMDGIRPETLQELDGRAEIYFDNSQETTDFQKALSHAAIVGATSTAVLNYEGSRVDHMLSTLFTPFAGDVRLIGSDSQARKLSTGSHQVDVVPGTRVSLIALEPTRVTECSGLRYSPVGLVLAIGGRDGVSNTATEDYIALIIESGTLLAFVQRHPGEARW
jgi:thiamine pyrophosphokinase